ncbi:glycosyl hydrolase family 28 protein [Nonomuraea sp. B12E4]|uniref:glycoside hydrolase family 28 protein n=1 Tax=Nonomuraea sp. B12E4 TaxID=3153564 RepID=UPI00325ED6B9
MVNSPMWEIHPTLSRNVLVRNVTVESHGPNNDGCNPESSQMVVIRGCTFDTGDDCIAIKSGRNADGRRVNVPSESILIENCTFRDGHGGVTIGSEMSGGVREVFVRDCTMSSPNLDIALRFKTNSVRGGFIEGVYARDIEIGQVGGPVIDINFYYEEGPGHGCSRTSWPTANR